MFYLPPANRILKEKTMKNRKNYKGLVDIKLKVCTPFISRNLSQSAKIQSKNSHSCSAWGKNSRIHKKIEISFCSIMILSGRSTTPMGYTSVLLLMILYIKPMLAQATTLTSSKVYSKEGFGGLFRIKVTIATFAGLN